MTWVSALKIEAIFIVDTEIAVRRVDEATEIVRLFDRMVID